MLRRVACIGVGHVGATCAYSLVTSGCAREVILVDIDEETCQGHACDVHDALPLYTTQSVRCGTYEDAQTADAIIISAGAPQEPGQDRCGLTETNGSIITDICNTIRPIPDHTIVIMITNPVDIMTYVAQQAMPEARDRIIGTGTWLDTQRLRTYIAHEEGIDPSSIHAYVVGEHGDHQVPVWSHATTEAGTAPVPDTATRDRITIQTRERAYRIIERKGATYYGIASCTKDILTATAYDTKRIIPVSTYLSRHNICLSMPTVLGQHGAERTVELTLAPDEQERLVQGAKKLRDTLHQCRL